jgi:5-methylcytosine-specific restriction endonuclease McrA
MMRIYNRARIIKRDKGLCVYCGSTDNLSVDHVIPRSRAGECGLTRGEVHSDSNLVSACSDCNSSKSNKLVTEFLGGDTKRIATFLRKARYVNNKIKNMLA